MKMYRIYRKILHLYEGDLKKLIKIVRNFMGHFGELPENQGGITCMLLTKRSEHLFLGCIDILVLN